MSQTKARDRIAWKLRNPEKNLAHKAVNRAVARGDLARPDVCSNCGEPRKVQAHHDDYSERLTVTWLCQPCHKAWHLTTSYRMLDSKRKA